MKTPWFKPIGLVHVPTTVSGAMVTLLALLFCAQVFFAVDHRSHSVTDTLYGVYPFFVCTFLLWDWLARKMS